MDDCQLRRELRHLKGAVLALSALVGTLSLSAFHRGSAHEHFTEIDAERINIVEPDGKYRLVISNRPRSIGPIYKGKPFGYVGGNRPGIIFFNDEGTENGGIGFEGRRGADGKYRAQSGFSFDQFEQDQILTLDYTDNNGQRRTGFTVADRAEANLFDVVAQRDSIMKMTDTVARNAAMARLLGPRNGVPMYAQRVYVGRDVSKSAVINLSDPNGKPRLRLRVDSLGAASVEFLDEAGHVTSRIPEIKRP